MKFVNVRDLRVNASRVVKGVSQGEDVIVTQRGKPEAAMIRLTEEMIEEFILTRHPRFLKELESAYREYRKKGGISHQAMLARLKTARG